MRVALPVSVATLVTGAVIGAAVAWPEPSSKPVTQPVTVSEPVAAAALLAAAAREKPVSRSAPRVTLTKRPRPKPTPTPQEATPPKVVAHVYATADLNLWTDPSDEHTLLTVLDSGTRLAITGRTVGPWAEVVRDGEARWVTAAYLSPDKPEPEPTSEGGLSTAACAAGSEVESGITANAVALYRAVCAQFPQVTSYGGWRSDGEHSDGRALDIMVSDGSLGQEIADWVHAHSAALNVADIIWSQQIWTQQRSAEGWRAMEDRGSTTANHYDHVHVQVH